jgi:hypothetical protein
MHEYEDYITHAEDALSLAQILLENYKFNIRMRKGV